VRRFLAVAVHDSRSPLWHVLRLEGIRRGEVLGLRWSDIEWERGMVHISETVVPDQTKGGVALVQPRTNTGAGVRTVRLTSETLDLLASEPSSLPLAFHPSFSTILPAEPLR
jgi:integrase